MKIKQIARAKARLARLKGKPPSPARERQIRDITDRLAAAGVKVG